MTKKWIVIFLFFSILRGLCFADTLATGDNLPNGLYSCTWGMSIEDCQAILRKQDKNFRIEEDKDKTKTILICSQKGCGKNDWINKLVFFNNKLTTVICVDLPKDYSLNYFLKSFGTPKNKETKSNMIDYTWNDGATNLTFSTINVPGVPLMHMIVSNVVNVNQIKPDAVGIILVRGVAEPHSVGITGYNFYVSNSKDKDFKKVIAYRVVSIPGAYLIRQLEVGVTYYVCFSYADSAGISKSPASHPVSLTAQVAGEVVSGVNVDIVSPSISQNK